VLINESGQFATPRLKPFIVFLLGVAVGMGITSYAYNGAAHPEVQAPAAPRFVAPLAMSAASSEVDAKVEALPSSIERRQSSPAPKNDIASSAPSVDITLFESVDGGRTETIAAEPPTELVAESQPLEAAPAGLLQLAQVETAQEIDLRSETERSVPQAPTASDNSLLPHERL